MLIEKCKTSRQQARFNNTSPKHVQTEASLRKKLAQIKKNPRDAKAGRVSKQRVWEDTTKEFRKEYFHHSPGGPGFRGRCSFMTGQRDQSAKNACSFTDLTMKDQQYSQNSSVTKQKTSNDYNASGAAARTSVPRWLSLVD